MDISKHFFKFLAFFYEFYQAIKDIFTKPGSQYRLFLTIVFLSDPLLQIVDEFSKIKRIKNAMNEIGYIGYRRYFRSKFVNKDLKYSKQRYCPIVYVPGISCEPFPDKSKFLWASEFEKNYEIILNEFLNIAGEGINPYHVPEAGGRVVVNNWATYFFVDHYGKQRTENIAKCPKTWELLNSVPSFVNQNMTMFSVLDPHSNIKEHSGWSNLFTRVHLTLINKEPLKTIINVGNEVRGWKEGELLFLDDSFFHQVWNSSDYYRAVLFFDVWHYDFNEDEIKELNEIYTKVRGFTGFQRASDIMQKLEAKSKKKIFK